MKMRNVFACLLGLSLAVIGPVAHANMITGSVSFAGSWQPVDNSNTVVGIPAATGIDFGLAFVLSGTGSYVGVPVGTLATFADFRFSPSNTPISPEWSFAVGNTYYSFDLASIQVVSQLDQFLSLSGVGQLSITGYDPTPGNFNFTGTTPNSVNFSFTAMDGASPVPEPSTLLLLGSGLAGLGGITWRWNRQK